MTTKSQREKIAALHKQLDALENTLKECGKLLKSLMIDAGITPKPERFPCDDEHRPSNAVKIDASEAP